MKITIEHVPSKENEVILRYKELDPEIKEIITFLKGEKRKVVAQYDGEWIMLATSEIYYVESVDSKTFIYTIDKVLDSPESLIELENQYSSLGLVRIGKSQLVNLHHVKKLRSILNSRIEITLESGEKLVVSRHYAQEIKRTLGIKS